MQLEKLIIEKYSLDLTILWSQQAICNLVSNATSNVFLWSRPDLFEADIIYKSII